MNSLILRQEQPKWVFRLIVFVGLGTKFTSSWHTRILPAMSTKWLNCQECSHIYNFKNRNEALESIPRCQLITISENGILNLLLTIEVFGKTTHKTFLSYLKLAQKVNGENSFSTLNWVLSIASFFFFEKRTSIMTLSITNRSTGFRFTSSINDLWRLLGKCNELNNPIECIPVTNDESRCWALAWQAALHVHFCEARFK